jgi:uncharacterized protein (TIGR03083 family)
MTQPAFQPSFAELLSLIADRSAGLRTAVVRADVTARVPGCPEWSLRDLVAHIGEVHRFWAATVAAGPADKWPSDEVVGDTAPHGDLLEWSAESTGVLLAALEAAGPDAGCWTWWTASGVPSTAGAVARHQVHEAAVHAFDAQEAAGHPEPLPAAIAMDGVAEFLAVAHGSSGPWPHEPARVTLHAAEGRAWPIELGDAGGGPAASADVHGPASDLVLTLYGRVPLDTLRVGGDQDLVRRLIAWPPLD